MLPISIHLLNFCGLGCKQGPGARNPLAKRCNVIGYDRKQTIGFSSQLFNCLHLQWLSESYFMLAISSGLSLYISVDT